MSINLIHGDAVFDELAGEWDGLAGQGMTDTPFQSLAYQRSWWQHLGPDGASLHTVVQRTDEGELLAVGCFYLLDSVIYFNGCVEETDYLDLIVKSERAAEAWQVVLDCLCSTDFPNWTALDLCNVPDVSPTISIFPRIAQERDLVYNREIHEVCPVIRLPGTFEEYLVSLPKKQRHEVRRKLRRAQGANATVTVVGPEQDVESAVHEFLELLQMSSPEKRDWLNDGRRRVFLDVARASQANGTLQLLFAEVEGQKAAALYNFTYKDRTWVYNSGLDPAAFGHLSLGVVLTAKAIEAAILEGNSTFDFLRGSEEYKYRFGAEDTIVYRLHAKRRSGPTLD